MEGHGLVVSWHSCAVQGSSICMGVAWTSIQRFCIRTICDYVCIFKILKSSNGYLFSSTENERFISVVFAGNAPIVTRASQT
jgi:hypothetical protein